MAAAKATTAPATADFGIDSPGRMRELFSRGALVFLLGFGLWFMNRAENPQGGAALFAALAVIGVALAGAGAFMLWSSRTGKLGVREQILDAIPWRGDEKVLDAGCGRGLMMTGAAARLKSGKVTAIDSWDEGTTSEGTLANAKAAGVNDRVKIETGDLRRLSYNAGNFDVVLSALALHDIADPKDRGKALDELWRVTKPGGHIAIWDWDDAAGDLAHFKTAGAELVRESGPVFLWARMSRWFVVRKP